MTLPTGRRLDFDITVAKTRKIEGKAGHQSVFEALKKSCPQFFPEITSLIGGRDGRVVSIDLDSAQQNGKLLEDVDGRYLWGLVKRGLRAYMKCKVVFRHLVGR